MNLRAIFLVAVLFYSPLLAYAEGTTSSPQGSSVPDSSMGGSATPVESRPADPLADVPSAAVATATPAVGGSAVPRPPAVSAPAQNTTVQNPTPEPLVVSSSEPIPSDSFPFIPVATALALLGAGFAAFKLLGAAGTGKNTNPGNCDQIKKQLEAKKTEKESLKAQIAGQESVVALAERKLKEKAEEKIEEKKGVLLKKAKEDLKGKLFGKEGRTREGVEGVELIYTTYKDLQEKFEQAKKLLALLREKHSTISKETETLESSYAVCVGALSGSGLSAGVAGLQLPYASAAKAIIFDWGGVISSEVLWNWLRKNIPNIEEKKEYFQNLIDTENKGGGPEGLVAALAREADKMAETVAIELNLEQVVHVDMVLLIRALKKKYKIGLLSNANSHLREIITQNNLDDLFDRVLISAEHKMIKPDPAIFKKMLEMLDVKPEEAVFVDDRKRNTDAANALGIKTILFTSHDALVKEFKKLDITTEEGTKHES